MSSVQEEKPPPEPQKTSVRDIRNTELVSRLLAATPPYLFSALPLQPHAFFFSELLRSFVNARNGCRPPHYHRRFKRRSHKYFAENETEWRRDWPNKDEKKEVEIRPEVPLQLTVDKQPRIREPSPKRLSPKADPKRSPSPPSRQSYVDVGTEELPKPSPCLGRNPAEAVPASNLILPPPPPMWYPPLYNPQFGVDPLNFFIDLRVSGHIYDRKRAMSEGLDTSLNQDVRMDEHGLDKRREFGHKRHFSAFSVPSRTNSTENSGKYFDLNAHGGAKINNTSYIMKNLTHVYESVKSTQDTKNEQKEIKENEKRDASDVDDDEIIE